MSDERSFRTRLQQEDEGIFFEVPFDLKEVWGRARPPVHVTVNGHTYRSTPAVYGGRAYIPLGASNRVAAGVSLGDEIDVVLSLDTAAREVEVPPDLAAALLAASDAGKAWENLSYSHRREHVEAISQAKKPETRVRRIEKTIEALRARTK